jgi:Common central domain of tyrosinase
MPKSAISIRKNQASLSTEEKERFVAALLAVKASGKYDEYVKTHLNMGHRHHTGPKRGQMKMPPRGMAGTGSMGHMIHGNPTFLPWHRELLRRLELDLQAVDASVTVPYWDWTVDNLPTSSLWQADLLGGNGRASDGRVMDGPFAFDAGHWPLRFNEHPEPDLKRAFGVDATALPVAADVTACLAETPYDAAPWDMTSQPSFRNRLEGWIDAPAGQSAGMHDLVHVWVGGTMSYMSSPNDPVFFLHHAEIDRLWAQWQRTHPELDYKPRSGGPDGENRSDTLDPWGGQTTVASVLDHRALGYRYDDEP